MSADLWGKGRACQLPRVRHGASAGIPGRQRAYQLPLVRESADGKAEAETNAHSSRWD